MLERNIRLAEERKWWNGDKELRSTGELVAGGGLSGAVMSILYLIIGIAMWGGIGYLGDLIFSTTWLVWVGILIGTVGGLTLVFTHMARQNMDR